MKLNPPKILSSKRREFLCTCGEQNRNDIENKAIKPLRADQWIEKYGLKNLSLTRDDLNSMESRRIFGVNGTRKRVGILVDASDIFLFSQRGAHFICAVNRLLDEQLWNKVDAIYFAEFGTSIKCLWSEPQKFDETTLLKLKEYFRSGIRNAGGSNLLAGLKHMLRIAKVHDLEEIIIIVGSLPDQLSYLLMEYLELVDVLNPNIFFHFVSFDSQDTRVLETLRQLTEVNPKRISLHVYSSLKEELIWTGDDMLALRMELLEAKAFLIHIVYDFIFVHYFKKLANEVQIFRLELENGRKINLEYLLKNPWGVEEDGDILEFVETDDQSSISFLPRTSLDWINHHGLKAKRLDFYQMLTPYAMTKTSTFVPSIGKEVSGKTYTEAMVQLEWPDHSIKNVNIKIPLLKNYLSCLNKHIGLIEKRLFWLQLPTYRPFGTLVEENAIVVIDLSFHNESMLSNIQSFVKQLIESQIVKFVKFFNIITIGSAVESFEKTMVEVNRENLQRAWLWFKERGCAGTRNVMAALRTLANSTGGRYQCFSDDIVEYSDDVSVLIEEIETSHVFIKAATTLILRLKKKWKNNAW
ncbi:unnamed protein product [Rodentolepis nana]|uniref:VWFA domain-containing protein n=1 Tax=Rodentolepis nana TaxID=102285 RepID=A0A0R3TAV0_RODNA|nr:unnamed protein product [Rodentolepis nana]